MYGEKNECSVSLPDGCGEAVTLLLSNDGDTIGGSYAMVCLPAAR